MLVIPLTSVSVSNLLCISDAFDPFLSLFLSMCTEEILFCCDILGVHCKTALQRLRGSKSSLYRPPPLTSRYSSWRSLLHFYAAALNAYLSLSCNGADSLTQRPLQKYHAQRPRARLALEVEEEILVYAAPSLLQLLLFRVGFEQVASLAA